MNLILSITSDATCFPRPLPHVKNMLCILLKFFSLMLNYKLNSTFCSPSTPLNPFLYQESSLIASSLTTQRRRNQMREGVGGCHRQTYFIVNAHPSSILVILVTIYNISEFLYLVYPKPLKVIQEALYCSYKEQIIQVFPLFSIPYPYSCRCLCPYVEAKTGNFKVLDSMRFKDFSPLGIPTLPFHKSETVASRTWHFEASFQIYHLKPTPKVFFPFYTKLSCEGLS